MTSPSVHRLRPPGAAFRLHALVLERHDKPFAWGFRDCCLWACDAVHACTGRDPAADLRGAYFSARGAARIVRDQGGLGAMADRRIGPRIQEHEAIDGDVCQLHAGAYEPSLPGLGAFGVLWRGAVLVQGGDGLVVNRLHTASAWWRAQP